MIAYKATNNMKCEELTYQVGKTYELKGDIVLCQQGFHACRNPKDTLNYYKYNKDFKLIEIEVLGEETLEDTDKFVTNKIKVLRIIPKKEALELMKIKRRYNKKGDLVYSKDSDGFEEWYKYDKNDKLIHYKTKHWEEWYEYDEKRNLIHYRNSQGNEDWRRYDENSNMVYLKNLSGLEEWYEYDGNNNEVYYKNSKGFEYWREHDSKGNLIHFKQSKIGSLSSYDREYFVIIK